MTASKARTEEELSSEDGPSAEELAETFEALSHPRRVRLLRELTTPRYLREIASELGVSRQAAHHHLEKLVEAGLLRRRPAKRESGSVTEYVTAPEAIALVHEGVEELGRLPPSHGSPPTRTQANRSPENTLVPPGGRSLWVVRGLRAGRALKLPPGRDGPWIIGRDPETDLPLEADPFASGRHAEVWEDEGELRIADLASTNGTYVNGRQLDRREEPALEHGDTVELGRSVLLVRDP